MSVDENKILNHLIDVCEDGRDFYHEAAEQVENPSIKNTFKKIEAVRANVISDLKRYIVANGGEPKADGTMAGKTAQMFSQLKAKIANTDKSLVSDLEEAEDKTLEEFHEAMAKNLPEGMRSLLQEETAILQKTHDYMKDLKDHIQKAA